MNFVGESCAGDGEHVVGVLVSVGDQGGGGEHGVADIGSASEGDSSRYQSTKGDQERHRASDAK